MKKKIKEYFYVSCESTEKHRVGNPDCNVEWCGIDGYPKRCKCGGLIHADFGDENEDCEYWLYEKCDRCGGNFEEVEK